MRRRDFLGSAALTGAAWMSSGLFTRARAAEVNEALKDRPRSNAPRIPRREYGRTGVQLSVIGFPGFALKTMDQEGANRIVAESFERGINYFDVAPTYGDAEQKLGPALEPYRKNVFLACKTGKRDRAGAEAELKQSLERLRTDHFDLYQLHHITDVAKDVDAAFAKGGAMEVLIQAKKEGRVRFLGFSAHSQEAALAAMDRYDFDSALFPLNFACVHKGHFGPPIIAKAKEKGVAMLALKALARQRWPKNDPRRAKYPTCWYQPLTDLDDAEMSLRYTLSQPIVAAIPPASDRMHRLAMALAMDYQPIQPEQEQALKTLAEGLNPIFPQA